MELEEKDIEMKSSSDYYADIIKGNTEQEEQPDEEVSTPKDEIFRCGNCGYMVDLSNPPLDPFNPKKKLDLSDYIYQSDPSKIKCPNCGKKVEIKIINREEYEKNLKKAQEKKENKEERIAKKKRARKIEQIKDDLKELTEDMKDRLMSGEVTAKRFTVIYAHMARNIVKRYSKDIDIDWLDFRSTIFELSDGILKIHKEEQKSEEILEEFSEDINEDELYKAELEYYIEDNKFSIPDYELRKRILEYEKVEKDIRSQEYKKEIEEKYQKRKNFLLQKAEERERRQKLREIM